MTIFEEGIEVGMKHRTLAIARKMLADNFDIEMIKKLTGLSKECINSLQ